jgi:hypothetical protein
MASWPRMHAKSWVAQAPLGAWRVQCAADAEARRTTQGSCGGRSTRGSTARDARHPYELS